LKKSLISFAIGVLLVSFLGGCSDSNDDVAVTDPASSPSVPNPNKFFNRVASFAVCSQVGASCESAATTAAEIVAASADGMTLIYSNSPKGEIGFVDITDVKAPKALGALAMGGEPTSVTVLGTNALVAVNTSTDFINVSGKLVVVNIATRTVVAELDLGGQPDSVAVSKDGRYARGDRERTRRKRQRRRHSPAACRRPRHHRPGGRPDGTWTRRNVDLTGIATLYGSDPEPEYVSINEDNIAVVTLQENNHIALVNLATGAVTGHFPAGSVTLDGVDLTDERPNLVQFTETQTDRLREPDGVTWISKTRFATANEGDLAGGSRSFTVFNTDGSVAWDAGMDLEYRLARIGHTNDRRNDAKGNEPENVAFGRFGSTDYLFVASERSSVVAVYDMSQPTAPAYKQALPGALSPGGAARHPLARPADLRQRGG
jgi:hypothetical protein